MNDIRAGLAGLPRSTAGFGPDMERAQEVLLSGHSREAKWAALLTWLAAGQPCVFGRIAARSGAEPELEVCVVDADDLERGWEHVTGVVQHVRHRWKSNAMGGRPAVCRCCSAARSWPTPHPARR
ncbi:hypothetical protein E1193_07115 [Micromonospora sp. KC606]|uniref:hypothetical protein n=1 Tax=Micromonospora sp. KC606 TaxID=2530379 RepID=UPI00105209CC|nr:hypothetical protein [Micromonospora sp. KC606]TDC83985.1 hypothetical protein E1193_07115 [Micromonospora sp. KC606]